MERPQKGGFLVVDRSTWAAVERTTAIQDPATGDPLPAAFVAATYRGFDGEPWPSDDGLAAPPLVDGLALLDRLDETLAYYRRVRMSCHCDLIYLEREHEASGGLPAPNLQLLGFDCGYYETETNFYSALFHECLFGRYDELRRFARRLNESLLFTDDPSVDSFVEARDVLIARGADLETDEPSYGIRIYGWAPDM